jgi:hypothetical protein
VASDFRGKRGDDVVSRYEKKKTSLDGSPSSDKEEGPPSFYPTFIFNFSQASRISRMFSRLDILSAAID